MERLRISESGCAIDQLWEPLNIATPKLGSYLMVPMTQTGEILFLGGYKESPGKGEVSVLNLADLNTKVLIEGRSSLLFSESYNSYNLSKSGEVNAVIKGLFNNHYRQALVSYSIRSNKFKVLSEDLDPEIKTEGGTSEK